MGRIEAEWTSVDVSEQVYTRLVFRYIFLSVFALLLLTACGNKDLNQFKQSWFTDCEKCDLSRVNLSGADLSNAELFRAQFVGANLTGANLTGAHFTRANLSGANLVGVNLQEANLAGANRTGAYLGDTHLADAILTGANLTNVDYGSKLPPYTPKTRVPSGIRVTNGQDPRSLP